MQRILLVRLSALGDIIHSLPVIADIDRHWPNAIIDMAVDERFVEIPLQNHYIHRVISLPLKRLKGRLFKQGTFGQLRTAIKVLRSEEYDLVIDLHGLLKSAVVSRLARAKQRVGFHREQCREKPAAWFYQRHFLPSHVHNRVQWLRDLAAFAVGSNGSLSLDYALPPIVSSGSKIVVLFHSTSDDSKNWSENHWGTLGKELIAEGFRIELP